MDAAWKPPPPPPQPARPPPATALVPAQVQQRWPQPPAAVSSSAQPSAAAAPPPAAAFTLGEAPTVAAVAAAAQALFGGTAAPSGPAAAALAGALERSLEAHRASAAAGEAVLGAAKRLAEAVDASSHVNPDFATATFLAASVVLRAAIDAGGFSAASALRALAMLDHARMDTSIHRSAVEAALRGCVADPSQAVVAAQDAGARARTGAGAGGPAAVAALRFYLGATPALLDVLPAEAVASDVRDMIVGGMRCASDLRTRRAAQMCAAAALGPRRVLPTSPAAAAAETHAGRVLLEAYFATCQSLPVGMVDAELHAATVAAAATATPASDSAALLGALSTASVAAAASSQPRTCPHFRALLAAMLHADVDLIPALCDACARAVKGMRAQGARREACDVLVSALRGSDDCVRQVPLATFVQRLTAECAREAREARERGEGRRVARGWQLPWPFDWR